MTGDGEERLEDVDWAAVRRGRRSPGARTLAAFGTVVPLAAAFVYDYAVLADGRALLDVSVPLLGRVRWDVTALDWLFVLTLVALLCAVGAPVVRNRRLAARRWREFRRNRAAVLSLAYLLVALVVGVLGPALLGRPELDLAHAYQPPVFVGVDASVPLDCVGPVVEGVCRGTWAHPLGTTRGGTDLLTLVVHGMRVSLQVGLVASLLVAAVGTAVGTVAATAGGLVDELLMRYVDLQMTVPAFVLYLFLVYLFDASLFLLTLILGLTSWGGTARLVRSEALQRAGRPYVTAARSAGASTLYVVHRHVVPNVSASVVTNVTLLVPTLVLAEAGLAFLGLADPDAPSWGRTIAAGRNDLSTAWWVSTVPGVVLLCTVLAFNFLGDALRDALDPRTEGRS
jgi:peptide/nickel transport system permease protein